MFLFEGRTPFYLLLLASVGALAFAYGAEYFFAMHPCALCLYQRYVLMVVGAVCLLFLVLPHTALLKRMGLWALLGLFLFNSTVAFYQVLVEQKIVEAPKVCRLKSKPKTIEDFLAQSQQVAVPCDQPQGTFFGLTMAVYSLFFYVGLGGYTGLALYMNRSRSFYGRTSLTGRS
jgi:disulfide bond formation protein DsbB